MIKIDMKMPKSCYECRFSRLNIIDGRWCGINNITNLERDTRHSNCPLIECGADAVNIKSKVCNHRDSNGNLTIEYDSMYEMRSSDMYCIQCGEHGTREELEDK